MLSLSNLSKSYGDRVILDQADLSLSKKEKIGFIGRNGQGKSTLFKLINKEEEWDSGSLVIPKNYRIGTLRQIVKFESSTVIEEACLGLKNDDESYKAKKILLGLGFTIDDFEKSPEDLSSGFKLRLELAKTLVTFPDLLLLDEPTNYLDIISTHWLGHFLRSYPGEIMAISHDRKFLDSFSTHSLILSRNKLTKVKGNISKLLEQVYLEDEIFEKTRLNQEKKVAEVEKFINRFRAKATKAKQVQSRVKALSKLDRMEMRDTIRDMEIQFEFPNIASKNFLWIKNLGFSYHGSDKLISDLSFELKKGERLGVIGKNGKGKTTLLKLLYELWKSQNLNQELARDYSQNSGEFYFHKDLKISYFGQDAIRELYDENTVEEEISIANSLNGKSRVRAIAGAMLFSAEDSQKKIKVLSGGERARVVLGKIMANPTHVLLLDEPSNHLDVESIEIFINCLSDFDGAIVFVSHDEDFISALGEKFVVFQNMKSSYFEGDYNDFLNKIGWDELKEFNPNSENDDKGLSKKEKTKIRQEIIRERSKELRPLDKKIDDCEKQIFQFEEKIEALIQQLANPDTQEYAELSKDLKILEIKKDQLYTDIDELYEQKKGIESLFEEKLSVLN